MCFVWMPEKTVIISLYDCSRQEYNFRVLLLFNLNICFLLDVIYPLNICNPAYFEFIGFYAPFRAFALFG
jgi:hypothetical protein